MPSLTLNPSYLVLILVTCGKLTCVPDCLSLTTQTCLRCLTCWCNSTLWLQLSLPVHQDSPSCICWRVRDSKTNRKPHKPSANTSSNLSLPLAPCIITCTTTSLNLTQFLQALLWVTLQRCKVAKWAIRLWKNNNPEALVYSCYLLHITPLWQIHSDLQLGEEGAGWKSSRYGWQAGGHPSAAGRAAPSPNCCRSRNLSSKDGRMTFITWSWSKKEWKVSGLVGSWPSTDVPRALHLFAEC